MSIAAAIALTAGILLLVSLVLLLGTTDSNFKYKSFTGQWVTCGTFAVAVVLLITSVWTAALT